jgi:Holliday junction resolvase
MFTIDYNTACLKGKDLNEIISNEIQKKLIWYF